MNYTTIKLKIFDLVFDMKHFCFDPNICLNVFNYVYSKLRLLH